jgi:hypothetical protein
VKYPYPIGIRQKVNIRVEPSIIGYRFNTDHFNQKRDSKTPQMPCKKGGMSIGCPAKFASDSMAHGHRYRPIWSSEILNCVVPLGVRRALGFQLLRATLHLEDGLIRCVRGLRFSLVIGQKVQIGLKPFIPRGRADLVVWFFYLKNVCYDTARAC